ncbi:histidine phosphatase family protein [Roseobacter sp. YSTF-M11]|uniref:Histidine phosphatase family protein n=1 Tax=Roseobacter insulae TaxID=2859783 RepID=A0A9X1FT72_9RHOB|nr:histidine phosphatase family protein [Roseobacter insulae]MBW4706463.1 histidine phosphatase family protein [Roseobacter insulae]
MSHITLIRHGQANSGAQDEASYDKLSALGHQQSQWLGDHLRAQRQHHARLYTGTLKRHMETAASMQTGLEPIEDARLNELEYLTLARALESEKGVPFPQDQAAFTSHLPQVFAAWQNDEIKGAPERFADFEARVLAAIKEIAQGEGPALVVTSGGLISMVMRQVLRLDIHATAHMALAIYNTSQHRLFPIGGNLSPTMFNAIPHLENPDRHYAQTHV